ncbi:MAG: enoyl-CoA hydratase/isomerase family protein [Elusimicrobia bacterium]|nr:enoyl-CoA hydratase/isomerase family protein [Elusimicrobiota bacterium]
MEKVREAANTSELLVEKRGAVAILTLHRPQVLNALSDSLLREVTSEMEQLDQDPGVRVMVLTGGDKVFAAGADIKGMAEASSAQMQISDRLANWERIRKISKPIIAAVSGYALGGGCELAMSCDLIVASEKAVFGQPEILIGVMPGAGGTQRLTRAIGKYRAMEFILTGSRFTAQQGMEWGLINRVVPPELLMEEAMALAEEIASKPPLAVRLAKEAVSWAQDVELGEGLLKERQHFYKLFDTEDQKEGMRAFLEKRKPNFKGK